MNSIPTRATVSPRPLLDTQSGRLLSPKREQIGPGHWRLSGDLQLEIDYTDQGVWHGLQFWLQGAPFRYLPQPA